MKSLKLILLAAISLNLLLASCTNNSPIPEGEFSFSGISDNNEFFAFERQGGDAVTIAEEEIDMSQFDECSDVQIIDNITILSKSRLSYRAYNRWGNYDESRIEESDYTVEGDVLRFTFLDEFSNDELITMKYDGSELILYNYAITEQLNGNWSNLQFYYRQTNELILEDTALNRLPGNEGDKAYVMLYEQRFSM